MGGRSYLTERRDAPWPRPPSSPRHARIPTHSARVPCAVPHTRHARTPLDTADRLDPIGYEPPLRPIRSNPGTLPRRHVWPDDARHRDRPLTTRLRVRTCTAGADRPRSSVFESDCMSRRETLPTDAAHRCPPNQSPHGGSLPGPARPCASSLTPKAACSPNLVLNPREGVHTRPQTPLPLSQPALMRTDRRFA